MIKFGLDVSTVGVYADPRVLADLAADAEDAGWNGFFVWDVLFNENTFDDPVADPWVTLAAIALKTQHIRIGAQVTPLARRRPWQVAREAVTVDILSNGRLIFGAGLGFQAMDFDAFGEEANPKIRGDILDEALEVLDGLWSGDTFHFSGKHFQVKGAKLLPKAVQTPRIPVWIAGTWPNPRPFRRAARWDGAYISSHKKDKERPTPKDIKDIVQFMGKERELPASFDIAIAGRMPTDRKQSVDFIHKFYEAGATWWIETINEDEGSFEEMSRLIRNGPPKN
jgi:alkanesulfonate monooxygenase SsuD/methylene tetrahydromethanopterin reductase-like flavin-dependent oxidoreductase (luciferase family)